MRVLFVNPIHGMFKASIRKAMFNGPPLAMIHLAACLEEEGHECRVFDANSKGAGINEVMEIVRDFRPGIVGLHCLTAYVKDVILACETIKQFNHSIKTVVGGAHAFHFPKDIAESPHVDFVCVGEGEQFIVELTRHLETGSPNLNNILGIAYKDEDGQVLMTPPRPLITDLEALPFPAYHLLDLKDYTPARNWESDGNFAAISSGRGCPYSCTFCDIPTIVGTKYRRVSAEKLADMFERLNKDFNVNFIKITDPTFTLDKKRVVEFAEELLRRGINMRWSISATVQSIPGLNGLRIIKRAGCENVFFGIESGDPEILMQVKKITTDQAMKAVADTKQAGIPTHCSFIFGLPNETKDSIRRTIDFAKTLPADTVSFSIATPYPGTEMYRTFDNSGYILHKEWHRYEVEPVISLPDGLTPEYFNEIYTQAHREFYLRASYIFKRLLGIRSFKQLKTYMKMGLMVLTGRLSHKV